MVNPLIRQTVMTAAAFVAMHATACEPIAKPGGLPRLEVSDNRRFLVDDHGHPFFWLGDTAWELFHRLDREEARRYLATRAAQGFNVVQAVVLAELDGLTTPDPYGNTPLEDGDPTRPNGDYFRHVDAVIAEANSAGLYVGLLPTWGRYWQGSQSIFTPENAEAYGHWLGSRYRDAGVIWILGGDRVVETEHERAILEAMAKGLRGGDGGRHLITFHPRGGRSSSEPFHGAPWLDFNMLQSGHSADNTNYTMIEADYARQPTKPCIDGEPAYEYPPDAMPAKRPVGAVQVRRNAYWSVFAGGFGHTYGTHPVWQMYAPPRTPLWDVKTAWSDALDLPGAIQLVHLKRLMLSRPFLDRIPDQSLVQDGQGESIRRVQGTRDGHPGRDDASFLMLYLPDEGTVRVATGRLAAETIRGWWFDPVEGTARPLGEMTNEPALVFETPRRKSGRDWVLVLDDAARNYPPPGGGSGP